MQTTKNNDMKTTNWIGARFFTCELTGDECATLIGENKEEMCVLANEAERYVFPHLDSNCLTPSYNEQIDLLNNPNY